MSDALTARFRRAYLPGADCRVTAVRNALAVEGHAYSSAMVLGLSGALCFAYEPPPGRVPFHAVVGVSDQVVWGAAAALGAYVYAGTESPSAPTRAWQIVAHLEAGHPVHVAVHHPTIRALRTRAPQRAADPRYDVGRHWISLTAYDAARDAFTVFETDGPRPFELTADELASAWLLDTRAPRPFADPTQRCDGAWFSLRAAGDPAPLLPTAMAHALARVAHGFHAPAMPNVGRPALDALADAAPRWADAAARDDTIGPSLLFLPVLEGLLTGGGFGRKQYGRFLSEAAARFGAPALREGASLFADSAERWHALVGEARGAARPSADGTVAVDAARLRAAMDAHLGGAVAAERAQMAWLRDVAAAPFTTLPTAAIEEAA